MCVCVLQRSAVQQYKNSTKGGIYWTFKFKYFVSICVQKHNVNCNLQE